MYSLTYSTYLDKVYGGWYGKCLGGAAGAPVEGVKSIIEVDHYRSIMNPDLPNDDLDIQLLWLEVLEQKGPYLTSNDLADAWMEKCWYPFSEYGYFLKNYKRGIRPPYSGTFNNSFFKEAMGCPIRSEIWGFTFPGNPEMAVRYAGMDGVLDHADNSVWAEQFLAAMESLVFFEQDIERLLQAGLSYVPASSRLAACVRLVMDYHGHHPEDWQGARREVIKYYGHPDFTNAMQNLGFTVLALLYGNGDLDRTIQLALQCGYDTDCTCATAGAIIGAMIGYAQLPESVTSLIQDYYVIGIDVTRRSTSIRDLAEDNCRVGVSMLNPAISITDTPDALKSHEWHAPQVKPKLAVEYIDRPAIGRGDRTEFNLVLSNETEHGLEGTVILEDIPQAWILQTDSQSIRLAAGETIRLANAVSTPATSLQLKQTNLLKATLVDKQGVTLDELKFGIAGANVWKVYGPYLDPLDKPGNPRHPSPHGEGCELPSIESMVNNVVDLQKPYLDESSFSFAEEKPDAILNAYEDVLPIEEAFHAEGQACFYLVQDIVVEEDTVVWGIIGNNDGFKLWVNGELVLEQDETRYWTPVNNAEWVTLKKGSNQIILKLLRRTDQLKFSFALRIYEGLHWHKRQWFTDYSSRID